MAMFGRESSPSHQLGSEAPHQMIVLIGNKATNKRYLPFCIDAAIATPSFFSSLH